MLQAEAESFPVELSCSGTQCLELFLYLTEMLFLEM